MVRQRFRVLFRRWFLTAAKVCGPILLFELVVSLRQHFHYVPLGLSDLLIGTLLVFQLTAVLCWLWAMGEWLWFRLRRLRRLLGELRKCSRTYWKPEAVKTNRA